MFLLQICYSSFSKWNILLYYIINNKNMNNQEEDTNKVWNLRKAITKSQKHTIRKGESCKNP